MFSDKFRLLKITFSLIILTLLSNYMFAKGQEFQIAKENCLTLKKTQIDAIEVNTRILGKVNKGYLVEEGNLSFQIVSSENAEFVVGKKMKLLLACRSDGLYLLKYEEFGNLRILKVGVSLLGLAIALIFFFREFKFMISKKEFLIRSSNN